ncbi:MAG: UV DNA damage repair endonuclease UvsE [Weeksellaceae bacterium]
MNIGYACINNSVGCTSSRTFRLASYTSERFRSTLTENLSCLQRILQWNVDHNISFFRISSQIVPFASHPICTYPWQTEFKSQLQQIGDFIKQHNLRVSMHPDQFVLINSISEEIFARSVKELDYQAEVLDLMGLDNTHKLQIHVGGVYGDKELSIERFISRYKTLPDKIKRRLVIENDDRLYSLQDCLKVHDGTKIPILFDTFHHEILNNGETMRKALESAFSTWKPEDGKPIIDYSSQEPGARIGNHAKSIDLAHFQAFLKVSEGLEFNIMFEIKDKEANVLKAMSL